MTVTEKAAYIKGLMDGMKLDKESDQGRLFTAIADLLEDLSLSVADLEDETSAMREYIDELDTDMSALESAVYDGEEDDEEFEEDDEHDCVNCDEEECVVSLECPACGEEIFIEACELEDCEQLECPACGEMLDVVCEERIEEDDESESEE
ncbi:MAG: hypothetical protein J1E00_04980 [Oscillospiraceae bacterium]|nr:hypothetical protein [Oscillospiraceae bacterium]